MYSRWDFKKLLSDGYVDIIQPNLSHAGGITECKKIFSMAEAYDVVIQEHSLGIHYNNEGSDLLDYLKDSSVFDYKDVYVDNLTGPGLGIEIDENYVHQKAEISHNWRNPVWRHQDVTIAE